MADNGAANNMTSCNPLLYNLRPPSPENTIVYSGNGTPLAVE